MEKKFKERIKRGMGIDPVDYRWSSYLIKLGVAPQEWLDYDSCLLSLTLLLPDVPENMKSELREIFR